MKGFKNRHVRPIEIRIESLSGLSMDDVKVHYNSAKSAAVQAHAYTQGSATPVSQKVNPDGTIDLTVEIPYVDKMERK